MRIPDPGIESEGVDTESASAIVVDEARAREIPVRVWAPRIESQAPLVVLSHGMGECGDSYGWLGRSWASRGYWVIAPTHRGSDRELFESEGVRGIIASTRRPETWRDRFTDITFLLSAIEERDRHIPLVDRPDPAIVAVTGHSAGGFTACAVAGLQLGPANFGDPRVRALVSMSMPRLTQVVAREAWSTIAVPALHFAGTLDFSPHYWTTPAHRRIPYDNAAERDDQFLVTLRGATHSTYSVPEPRRDGPTRRLRRCVSEISGLFLDGWFRNDMAARERFAVLACDGLSLESRVEQRERSGRNRDQSPNGYVSGVSR